MIALKDLRIKYTQHFEKKQAESNSIKLSEDIPSPCMYCIINSISSDRSFQKKCIKLLAHLCV